ncbi:MAG: hypothetical protein RL208_465 [Pseudomonadota bacterium]|jgi:transcriptional regulator with XRE-family HTH domain
MKENRKKALGSELKKIRKSSNITQKELALQLGITAQQVACYELGQSALTIDRLFEISDILNVNAFKVLSKIYADKTDNIEIGTEGEKSQHNTLEKEFREFVKILKTFREESVNNKSLNV